VADLYEIDSGTFTRTVTRDHLEHIIEIEWGKVGQADNIFSLLDSGAEYWTGTAKIRKVEAIERETPAR
jgi:DNA-binding PadR family transcriptional regulator